MWGHFLSDIEESLKTDVTVTNISDSIYRDEFQAWNKKLNIFEPLRHHKAPQRMGGLGGGVWGGGGGVWGPPPGKFCLLRSKSMALFTIL